MNRLIIQPRNNWQAIVEQQGFIWHTASNAAYWNESAYYEFTYHDIQEIKHATTELYEMFLEAGQYVIDNELFHLFCIPPKFIDYLVQSWNDSPPCLNYGRFDLAYDGITPPKLLEFNCDTPTSLVEASIIQKKWLCDVFHDKNQFNFIESSIIDKWHTLRHYLTSTIHFAHTNDHSGEDIGTIEFIAKLANKAGFTCIPLFMENIGICDNEFVDMDDKSIDNIYKLYPWEWLCNERFSDYIIANDSINWIEPIWKMLWSNKAILPILWDLFPRHTNLLWATFDSPNARDYVRKPILSREGSNVEIYKENILFTQKHGPYAKGKFIYQDLYDLPDYSGNKPVIGSWIIDNKPIGIGVREDGLITGNLSRFVPHIIKD